MIEHMPFATLLLDENKMVIGANRDSLGICNFSPDGRMPEKIGKVLNCRNSLKKGCGRSGMCADCPLSKALDIAIGGNIPIKKACAKIVDAKNKMTHLVFSISRIMGQTLLFLEDVTEKDREEEALRQNEERYRALFESMDEGFALCEIICDKSGSPCNYRFLEINKAYEKLTGMKACDVVGKTIREMFPDGKIPTWVGIYGDVALTGRSARFENYNAMTGRYYETFSSSPEKGKFTILFVDTSERKFAEQRIEHLASFPQLDPNPIIEMDSAMNVNFANKAAKNLARRMGDGHDLKKFLPKDINMILKELQKNKVRHVYREIRIGDEFFGETIYLTPQYDVFRIYAVNITRRKAAEERIIYSSVHDMLTGVHNRYYFEKQLEKYKKLRNFNGGVVMIDVNGLKRINDNYGHFAGDRLIKGTANFLNSQFREKDLVARFGGDEFCILLPDIKKEELEVVAERLRAKAGEIETGSRKDFKIDIAIGTAYAQKSEELDGAIKAADEAMYQDKIALKKRSDPGS